MYFPVKVLLVVPYTALEVAVDDSSSWQKRRLSSVVLRSRWLDVKKKHFLRFKTFLRHFFTFFSVYEKSTKQLTSQTDSNILSHCCNFPIRTNNSRETIQISTACKTVCWRKNNASFFRFQFDEILRFPGAPGEVQLEARSVRLSGVREVFTRLFATSTLLTTFTTGGGPGANPQDPETEPSHSEGRTGIEG